MLRLTETTHRLGLGRLLGVAAMVVVEQQQADLSELVVAAWQKLLQVQLDTPQVEALETRQLGVLEVVEAIDPAVAVELLDLQRV
jgi:hypothetical protein